MLRDVVFEEGNDLWKWKWSRSGDFSVRSMYKELWRDRQSTDHEVWPFAMEVSWDKNLPLKIKFFIWTTLLGRILTNDNLIRRGKGVNPVCSECRMSNEDIPHLFLHCSRSLKVWKMILGPRQNVYEDIFAVDSLEDWLIAWPVGPVAELGSRVWELLPYATAWILWKTRNCRVFQLKVKTVDSIVGEIKGTIWFWLGSWPRRKQYNFQDLLFNWDTILSV
ncbi:hypothetical protein FRX31_003481 [Thalictrum thalictroides]|uniref:Reverse transcriptase zinc-binding domain-containing protein n=1 Tax=Thalictrum thalictroides TaxID=46969 RepID=A0A7J6XBR1_THATH|nr:hypothetical protein FRX31_003481 [Thalictrum thalictroides]